MWPLFRRQDGQQNRRPSAVSYCCFYLSLCFLTI
nr:MAG TPA: hypothetical protein [Caudoviricetes sp.]DAM37635.1 MAG TPA: hypothetical protein [Caudoviricetes sp.]